MITNKWTLEITESLERDKDSKWYVSLDVYDYNIEEQITCFSTTVRQQTIVNIIKDFLINNLVDDAINLIISNR